MWWLLSLEVYCCHLAASRWNYCLLYFYNVFHLYIPPWKTFRSHSEKKTLRLCILKFHVAQNTRTSLTFLRKSLGPQNFEFKFDHVQFNIQNIAFDGIVFFLYRDQQTKCRYPRNWEKCLADDSRCSAPGGWREFNTHIDLDLRFWWRNGPSECSLEMGAARFPHQISASNFLIFLKHIFDLLIANLNVLISVDPSRRALKQNIRH